MAGFCDIYKHIYDRNMSALGQNKLMSLWLCGVEAYINVQGSFAEAGVYAGGSLYLLASLAKDRKVFGFDSFEGLPESTIEDCKDEKSFASTKTKGVFKVTLDKVKANIGDEVSSKINFVPGYFEETLNDACIAAKERFAFVHLDVDLYQSYKRCFEFFVPRMNNGGIIVIDEYGFEPCPGCRLAYDEYFNAHPEFRVEKWFRHVEQQAIKAYKQ